MKKILVGKIHNTHGLNGELKVSSDFKLKNKIFINGFKVYIDNKEYIIENYRTMNKFDLLSFDKFDNIDKVSNLKNKLIYINREDLNLKNGEYLYEDLINMNIILDNKNFGKVIDFIDGINPLLEIDYEKKYYIPIKDEFIKEVDLDNNVIYVYDSVKELIL